MSDKEKKLNESSDDTFNKDYQEILDFEATRPDSLLRERFPIEERFEEIVNSDFEKE